jgi:ABC-2 type transport system ATP-binding protein
VEQFIIQTSGLTRRYKEFVAVDALDLQVPSGCVYGFLGPNGAGKTTTIRMLLGVIKPTVGSVQLFGADVNNSAQRKAILKRVGSLVEMPALYPHLSGRENLEVTRRMLDIDPKHIDRVLKIVSLTDAADRPTRAYSLGMKQRLGLALALLGEPSLLILDEPTNGLDPAGIHEIRDLIRAMPEQYGITVFLSSHLLSEIEVMATHIGIVNHGKRLFQGTLASLQAQRQNVLVLGVHQPEEALRFLQHSGWKARRENGHLEVVAQSRADVAAINTSLVQQGLHVYQLTLQQPSLEEMFLQMTGDSAAQ